MLCCSLLVATSVLLGRMEPLPTRPTGFFSTPMFLRGEPIWITPISRRQLRLKHKTPKEESLPETEVAVLA